jgi:hypothetical protein
VDEKFVRLDSELKTLDDKISTVTAKLDRYEAGMRDGLLNGRSRPSLLGSLGGDMFSLGNWHGPGQRRLLWRGGPGGSGIWTEWSLGDDGFNLTWVMEFYDGYIDFRDAHLGLAFDNAFLPGIEMVIADENNYPALSLLIFNGGGDGFDDDFHDIDHLSGRKDLIKSAAGYGARGGQDIYIRRKSEGDWWPFSDTQFVATQTYNYWYGHYLNDVVANFKLRGMPMFWPFERADPAITTLWSFNDAAEISAWSASSDNAPTVPDNSSAQSFAINMLIVGGGTFYLEAATAEWERSDVAKDYRDYSVATVISKSIGPMAVVLDYQHTGPDYFPGTQEEPSGNAASSLATIKTAAGKDQQVWKTVASEPTGPTSNSEHISVGTTLDLTSASIGFSVGSNIEIEPSGFLLTTRHMIGFPWDGLKNNGGAHGFEMKKDQARDNSKAYTEAYDGSVSDVAVLPDGNTVQLKDVLPKPDPNGKIADGTYYTGHWTTLDSANREAIVLTEHGVGDNHLRPDSIKYVNFVDVRGDVNFQSLFDMQRPCLLKLATRLRNTQESFALPAYSDESFLMQIASSATFNVTLPKKMQFVTAVGYEDWASKASFIPIEYHTRWLHLQFIKDLPEFMSDFSIGPDFSVMQNEDPHNSGRDFSAWFTSIGASTTF